MKRTDSSVSKNSQDSLLPHKESSPRLAWNLHRRDHWYCCCLPDCLYNLVFPPGPSTANLLPDDGGDGDGDGRVPSLSPSPNRGEDEGDVGYKSPRESDRLLERGIASYEYSEALREGEGGDDGVKVSLQTMQSPIHEDTPSSSLFVPKIVKLDSDDPFRDIDDLRDDQPTDLLAHSPIVTVDHAKPAKSKRPSFSDMKQRFADAPEDKSDNFDDDFDEVDRDKILNAPKSVDYFSNKMNEISQVREEAERCKGELNILSNSTLVRALVEVLNAKQQQFVAAYKRNSIQKEDMDRLEVQLQEVRNLITKFTNDNMLQDSSAESSRRGSRHSNPYATYKPKHLHKMFSNVLRDTCAADVMLHMCVQDALAVVIERLRKELVTVTVQNNQESFANWIEHEWNRARNTPDPSPDQDQESFVFPEINEKLAADRRNDTTSALQKKLGVLVGVINQMDELHLDHLPQHSTIRRDIREWTEVLDALESGARTVENSKRENYFKE